MKKMNNYICYGLLLNGIWILSIRFNLLTDFIEGVMVGLGLLFVIIGMYYEKYDISKIKNYKKKFLNIILTKWFIKVCINKLGIKQ